MATTVIILSLCLHVQSSLEQNMSVFQLLQPTMCIQLPFKTQLQITAEDTHFHFLIFLVFHCLITIMEMSFQHSHHHLIPPQRSALPAHGTEAEIAALKITVCIFPMYFSSGARRGRTAGAS